MANPLATVAGTLRDAKSLIETRGFSQGRAGEDWRAVGLHESIVRCMGARRGDAIAYLAVAIGAAGKGSLGIEDWANRSGRTEAQISAAFDRAIAAAEMAEA